MIESTAGRIHRAVSWAVSVMMLLTFCGVLFIFITLAWPYDQLPTFKMEIEGQAVAGQDIIVRVDYCKTHDWTASAMRWSLQNSITIPLDWQPFTIPSGCHSTRVPFTLSHKIPPGLYVLQHEVFYDPWPWRTVAYIHRSGPFEVLAAQ